MIRINGRGWRGGPVVLRPSSRGLEIRIDDDWNPELWLSIDIDVETFKAMFLQVEYCEFNPTMTASPLGYPWGERDPAATQDLPSPEIEGGKPGTREHFDYWWRACERHGRCDAFGGAQYRRLLAEWLHKKPQAAVEAWIIIQANQDSGGAE